MTSDPESPPLDIVELTDLNDDLLLPWLDLFETAFPPAEKVLVSDHLKILKQKSSGHQGNQHLLAAVTPDRKLAGMARYQIAHEQGVVWLWYLAVTSEVRNQGIGSRFYRAIYGRALKTGCRALFFEVEIPEEASTQTEGELSRRRIAFYQRQGASLLEGVRYVQTVNEYQPEIPMHVMLHPFQPLDAETALQLAKSIVEDSIQQVGPLALRGIQR